MKHSHYYKSVAHLDTVDVYRILTLFKVTDPCIQHAVKKLLVAGGRGAGKDIAQDIQETIDTLERWKVMQKEDTPYPTVMGMRYLEVPDHYQPAPLQTFCRSKREIEEAHRQGASRIHVTRRALREVRNHVS